MFNLLLLSFCTLLFNFDQILCHNISFSNYSSSLLIFSLSVFNFFFSGVYEVLPTEPLHDMKEHICNVVSEIKDQLSQEEKQLCVKTIELVAQTEEPLCGSDREMAIVLSKQLRGLQQLNCICIQF